MHHSAAQLNIVGVGPQKTGSSWLYHCLKGHSQLNVPRGVKETFFFDDHFHKGWSWYFSHFKDDNPEKLNMEIGPTYFDAPEAPCRIYQHNPNCRIIVSLRDPAARSFSLYLHHRKYGDLRCNFDEAILQLPKITRSSHYKKYLKNWLEVFGEQQVHIILQEDIANNPKNVLKQLYQFIGIDHGYMPQLKEKRVNEASLPAFPGLAKLCTGIAGHLRKNGFYYPVILAKKLGLKSVYKGAGNVPSLDPEMREFLVTMFEPDIKYVEKITGRNLAGWR